MNIKQDEAETKGDRQKKGEFAGEVGRYRHFALKTLF